MFEPRGATFSTRARAELTGLACHLQILAQSNRDSLAREAAKICDEAGVGGQVDDRRKRLAGVKRRPLS